MRSHTLENKLRIFDEVEKCGFTQKIVATFSNMTSVDDLFVQTLIERGEDRSGLWAFSEINPGKV